MVLKQRITDFAVQELCISIAKTSPSQQLTDLREKCKIMYIQKKRCVGLSSCVRSYCFSWRYGNTQLLHSKVRDPLLQHHIGPMVDASTIRPIYVICPAGEYIALIKKTQKTRPFPGKEGIFAKIPPFPGPDGFFLCIIFVYMCGGSGLSAFVSAWGRA